MLKIKNFRKLISLCLFFIVTVFSVMTASAAAPSVTKTEDTLMTYSGMKIVSYGGYLNGESFQQDGITTYNGYEYSAFWNTNKHVVLCRRKLPDGAWSKFEFTDYTLEAQDSHNTISIGICPGDGTIHLAFDHHDSNLHYRVSVPGLATNPANYSWNASNFGAVTSCLVGTTKVSQVTYPRFITEPSNKMLFECRIGASGSGNQHLWEYDGVTHKWTSLGKYIDGITLSNNAYAHGITYDKNGRLHETWCWRETPDASSNHDLMYVYSDDNGRTWKNNAGTTVAKTGSSFIDKNTQGIKVWTINMNRGLINQEAQAVDNNGQIHVLLSHMKDSQPNDSNFTSARSKSVYFHYWRDSKGIWHRSDMGFSAVKNFRGKLAFSTANNLYAILPNIRIASASAASNWNDWALVNTQDSGRFFSDPLIDTARLKAQANTLTLFCPVPNSSNIYNITYKLDSGSGNVPQGGNSVEKGLYKIINRNSGKALDVSQASKNDGADVIQWSDNGGTNQQWWVTPESGGTYSLRNYNSSKALDVSQASKNDGADVIQWGNNEGQNQRWTIIDVGGGYYKLINSNSGKALDVNQASKNDGGNVIQWSYNGSWNQQWKLVRVK